MSKFSEITQILRRAEQGRFQLACIDYLKHNVGGVVHSPGTVDDKEKTKKNHPDVYLKQTDGKYVLAECTTKENDNQKDFVKKLKNDLIECLNFEKLNIPQEKVAQIYLCCNSSVDPGTYEELEQLARPYNIKLIIVGVHELASYFCSSGKIYAKDNLGVAFQTGQILTKEQFISQYGKKNISTPLDNPLIGREEELKKFGSAILHDEVIVLNGPPGVGKSRLAIEAMDRFISLNKDYVPYYIFSKTGEISDDLATYLKPGNKYLLLIDDANRQIDNLTSILEKLIESEIKLKVILTVRDYAKGDIDRQLGKLGRCNFPLRKLTDEKISEILSEQPFAIRNWQIKERIQQISKGNPRLAIMSANVIAKNMDLKLLSDVTTIYDEYFQSVINDKALFEDKKTRQVLGLVGYFDTLDISDGLDRDIIGDFFGNTEDFFDTALQLQDMEIVEIYDNTVVKVSEQVMATYFFFTAFFRDEILCFRKLLQVYFRSHFHRVRDAVLGAINTFGPEKIIVGRTEDWNVFWNSIETDKVLTIQFLRIFGAYFHSRVFQMMNRNMEKPVDQDAVNISFETIDKAPKSFERDAPLELLSSLFNEKGIVFETAVYLGFKYALKDSSTLATLTDDLSGKLLIGNNEINSGFKKLDFVYDFLKGNLGKHPYYRIAFYYILNRVVLSATRRAELYIRQGDRYEQQPVFREFRQRIFQDMNSYHTDHGQLVYEVLLSYATERDDLSHLEILGDFPFIIPILGKLDPTEFGNCFLVQKYSTKVMNITGESFPELEKLAGLFQAESYKFFERLNIKYNFSLENHDEYRIRKMKAIENSVKIHNLGDWQQMEIKLIEIHSFIGHANDIGDSISILLRATFTENMSLGFDCLYSYLKKDNFLGLSGSGIYAPIMAHSQEKTRKLFSLLNEIEFKYRNGWFRDFFYLIPKEYINPEYLEGFVSMYRDHQYVPDIYQSDMEKFEVYRPGTTERVLQILVDRKNADDEFVYKLTHDFFKTSPHLVTSNLDLCKAAFKQQHSMPGVYDFDCRELLVFVKAEDEFFFEYLDFLLNGNENYIMLDRRNLTKVWELEGAENIVYKSLLKISMKETRSSYDHLGGVFFYGVKDEQLEACHNVFSKIVDNHGQDIEIINLLIDTLRNSVPKLYMFVFSELLDKNSDISFFKELQLHNNHFSTTTNQIWPEARAKELKNLVEMISSKPTQYLYFEHLAYLQERLEGEIKAAKSERKLMFRGYW